MGLFIIIIIIKDNYVLEQRYGLIVKWMTKIT